MQQQHNPTAHPPQAVPPQNTTATMTSPPTNNNNQNSVKLGLLGAASLLTILGIVFGSLFLKRIEFEWEYVSWDNSSNNVQWYDILANFTTR